MTKRAKLIIFAGTFAIMVIVFLSSCFIFTLLTDFDMYRAQILSLAERSLGRPVSYKTASFSWDQGPSFVFTDVSVREKESTETFLACGRLAFRLAVVPLLRKEVDVSGILLDRPVISLSRDKSGTFNINDFIRAKPGNYRFKLEDIRIRNGTVRFADRMPGFEGFQASLENLELDLNGISRGGTSVFRLSAAVTGAGERTLIACSGKAEIPPDKKPMDETFLDLTLSVKDLDAGRYWPYYGRRLPFEKIRAIVDYDGAFRGTPAEFNSRGSFAVRGLRFSYPAVFHGALTPRDLRLSYDMALSPRKLSVDLFDLALDGLRVKGNGSIIDLHGKDPFIRVRAATAPFNLADTRQYIPYGIIVKSTADFIEKHINGGVYRLDSGVLDGRLSRILHLEKEGNRNVLSIRGRVEKGIVGFGPGIPVFGDIKGELELDGRDFSLRGMSGRFGGAPFTLDGKIAGYTLASPNEYPFTAKITPGRAEIAWLLPADWARKAEFGGPSELRLEGSGTADDYRLGGAWNLDGAEYAFPELLRKRAGRPNSLSFDLRLRPHETELTEMLYQAPPMSLKASARYRYGDREPLTFAVSTNRFQVDESFPVFPGMQKFRPEGMLRASVSGSGNPAETGGMHWRGTVSLEAFSLRHNLPINQVSKINGTIRLYDSSVEIDRITASLGSSPITVRGRLSGFSNPTADLAISSRALRLEDLGFRAPGIEAEVKNLSGNFRLSDKNLTVAYLSGQVKSSTFILRGDVADIENPRISVAARFPFLRVEDLLPLARLRRAGEHKAPYAFPPLEARIKCDSGTFRDISFRKLDTDLNMEHKQILIRSLKTEAFSGRVSANGLVDMSSVAGPAYRAQYRLEHVNLAQIESAAGSKLVLGGHLTAGGELVCSGNNMDELKKSARGHADAELSDAVIRMETQPGRKKLSNLEIKKLSARLSLAEKVLEIQSARIDAFGGVVKGGATLDFNFPDGPRYRIGVDMKSADAKKFFSTFEVTREVSGRLALKGDLSASGDSLAALKKTVRGTVGMHLEKGAINKFNVLSKIFSIIDVSQLLSFRLPDMVTTGMPYNRIDGDFSVKDGIVSTSDLRVNSPSVNITVTGKTDIVKEELDMKIGVQPLRTVGKIVDRIPIVGWILTGGKRNFLATYYTAKGKWSDPKVSAIPISSLGRGIINILRRILNLPEKLITEPGEVIIGK